MKQILFLLLFIFLISCTPNQQTTYPPSQEQDTNIGSGCGVSQQNDYEDLGIKYVPISEEL